MNGLVLATIKIRLAISSNDVNGDEGIITTIAEVVSLLL